MDRHYAMSRAEVLDICDRTPREAADRVFFTGSGAGLLGPLVEFGGVSFVKAFYRRPFVADGVVLPDGADWTVATQPLQQAFVEHPGLGLEVLGGIPAV